MRHVNQGFTRLQPFLVTQEAFQELCAERSSGFVPFAQAILADLEAKQETEWIFRG